MADTSVMDIDALAEQYGGRDASTEDAKGAAPARIDYDALAAKFGGRDYVAPKPIDLDALAAQFGGKDELPPDSRAANAPGVPKAPLPEGLKSDAQVQAEAPYAVNPRTGERYHTTPFGQSALDFPFTGAEKVVHGVEKLAAPTEAVASDIGRLQNKAPQATVQGKPKMTPELLKQAATGASQVIGGTLEATAPFVLPAAAAAAPLATAATLYASAVTPELVGHAMKQLGVSPEYSNLAGDIAALLVGYAAGKFRVSPEQANLIETLQGKDAQTPEGQAARIDKLRAMASDPGASQGERDVASALLQKNHGINHPAFRPAESAAAPADTVVTPAPAASEPAAPGPSAQPVTGTVETAPISAIDVKPGAMFQDQDGRTVAVTELSKNGKSVKITDDNARERTIPLTKFLRQMTVVPTTAAPSAPPSTPAAATPQNQEVAPPAQAETPVGPTTPELQADKQSLTTAENTPEGAVKPLPPEALPGPAVTQVGAANGEHVGKEVEAAEAVAPAAPVAPVAPVEPSGNPGELVPSEAPAPEPVKTVEALAPNEEPKEPEAPYKFSSTQVNLPTQYHRAFADAVAGIPDSELAEDGREDDPHITALYGIHGTSAEPVKKLLKDTGPITATIGPASIFPGKDGKPDVLKLDIDSPQLHDLNAKLRGLEHTNKFPDYTPHMTLAYLRPGEGAKYVGQAIPGLTGQQVTFNRLTFSGSDQARTEIPLAKQVRDVGQVTPKRPRAVEQPAEPKPASTPADKLDEFNLPPEPPKASASHVTLGSGFGNLQSFYDDMVKSIQESAAEIRDMEERRQAANKILQAAEPTERQKERGDQARFYLTGERDMWQTRVNQVIHRLRKFLPNPTDQEALSLMKDFKNRPGELQQFADRTHPDLLKLPPEDKAEALTNLAKIDKVIQRALNPTDKMQLADDVLTELATASLREGQRLGFLNSSLTPEEYVPHYIRPADSDTLAPFTARGKSLGNKIGLRFSNANQRTIPTLLHAVSYGLKPRTLNALDAFTIHGDKFATARATHMMVKELTDAGLAKYGSHAGDAVIDGERVKIPGGAAETDFAGTPGIPADWKKIAPHDKLFEKHHAYIDKDGNAGISTMHLYAPPAIAEALRPVTDPAWTGTVRGVQAVRMIQGYIKTAELGLSLFHLKAENYMALANMGIKGWLKAQTADVGAPYFLEGEREMALMGGTTPTQGHTIEAYRALNSDTAFTRLDQIRKLPGIKQADQAAGALTKLIFQVEMRRFKVMNFILERDAWKASHPRAVNQTPAEYKAEYTRAMRSIASELNAVYGGLHWENMGVNKSTVEIARLLMLAPDWTFSNFQNVGTTLKGQPILPPGASVGQKLLNSATNPTEGAKNARMFWVRTILGVVFGSVGISLLMNRDKKEAIHAIMKDPRHGLTMVYLGKDKKTGQNIWANYAAAGAASDALTMANDYKDYGLVGGAAQFAAGKESPTLRVGVGLLANQDRFHRPVMPKGLDPLANTGRAVEFIAHGMMPVPFSFQNLYDQMSGNTKQQHEALEMVQSFLMGIQARRMDQPGYHLSRQGQEVPDAYRPENSIWDQFVTGQQYKEKGR